MEFVTANNERFAYLSEGRGPLVLFMHGFPDTAHTWTHALGEVARAGFRGVAPFTRGYFPSEIAKGAKYDAVTLGTDIVALIDALQGDAKEPAIVVGHDWGALATYTAAALAPAKLRAIVTLAVPHPASVCPSPIMLWKVRHFFALCWPWSARCVRAHDYRYVDVLWRRWSPDWKHIPPEETAAVKEAFAHPGCAEAACAYYAALRPWLPAPLKQKISVPAWAIAGLNDTLPPSDYEKAKSRFTGPYEVVTVPGGHFLHREHPADFAAALLAILKRL